MNVEDDEIMTRIDQILKRKPFIVPSECPECGSKNIMGYAQVVTHSYINLTDMSIDEIDSNSDVELYDNDPSEILGLSV